MELGLMANEALFSAPSNHFLLGRVPILIAVNASPTVGLKFQTNLMVTDLGPKPMF